MSNYFFILLNDTLVLGISSAHVIGKKGKSYNKYNNGENKTTLINFP